MVPWFPNHAWFPNHRFGFGIKTAILPYNPRRSYCHFDKETALAPPLEDLTPSNGGDQVDFESTSPITTITATTSY